MMDNTASASIGDALSETKGLLSLLRSNNLDLQHNALKGLMFCPTSCVVSAFSEDDNLHFLINMTTSTHKRLESAALRLVWHLSAQAELKVRLYEEGVLTKLKDFVQQDDPELQLACAAILQNISEYRFDKGCVNPNQVKIVNEGAMDILTHRLTSGDKRVQFLTCLTICNLSMNEENARKMLKNGLLDEVQRFVEDSKMHVDMVCHWITLQPHVPLLRSPFPQIQLFALSCLITLIRNDQYKVEVWKALSINKGVKALFQLDRSTNFSIQQLAREVLRTLQIENHAHVGTDLSSLLTEDQEFTDVVFQCRDGEVRAHKAILAARSPQFRAMFTRFREAFETTIHLPEMDSATMRTLTEFIYTGHAHLTRRSVVDVLVAADMYGLTELKQRCECFLWDYIDIDNVANLHQLATLHHADQLRIVCENFFARNFSKITHSPAFTALSADARASLFAIAGPHQKSPGWQKMAADSSEHGAVPASLNAGEAAF